MLTRTLLLAGLAALAATGLSRVSLADDKDGEKEKDVAYKVYDGYFESNKSGLKGKESFQVFRNKGGFDKVFRAVPPLLKGKKKALLPDNVFEKHVVVAVVKRGNQLWTYKVTGVSSCKGKVNIRYMAEAKDGGGARFASPLIVAIPIPADAGRLTFRENDKEVKTLELPRD
jgi:hypothetical protein